MLTLGLDIGTTSISAVVCEGHTVIASKTIVNDSRLSGEKWESLQDAEKIIEKSFVTIHSLCSEYPEVAKIGITGQMHGIVYLDGQGKPVSPLINWKDGRGDLLINDKESWAQDLSKRTGYRLSTGYGALTHYVNRKKGWIPQGAKVFCTIGDYLAMKLAGRKTPIIHPTNAASLGLFDLKKGFFDGLALKKAGLSPDLFPEVSEEGLLGRTENGIGVFQAIGDNQASFLGTSEGAKDSLLINVGTGSQISVYSPDYMEISSLETRPYVDGGWLLVGAALSGGLSFALLESFFRQTVKMVTGEERTCYGPMIKAMEEMTPRSPEDVPVISPLFHGTRQDPTLAASITGLRPDNFTPQGFILGMMKGMSHELYQIFEGYLAQSTRRPLHFIGSGNGLRQNPYLVQIIEEEFGRPLRLSDRTEETACGAALYACQIAGQVD